MDTATLINGLTAAALIAIMLKMGLMVTAAELLASVRRHRLVGLGLLSNFVLVPGATYLLLLLFQTDPMVSVGFLILAVSPGAPVGPPMTGVARGDVPFSIAMMVVLAVLSTVLSPALLGFMTPWIAPASNLEIDSLAIVRALLLSELLPLAFGLAIRQWLPSIAERAVPPIGFLANVLLVVLAGLILWVQFGTLADIRLRGWIGMTFLLLASLGVGWLAGGPALGTRKAMAVTTASRNVAVGLVIATRSFADTAAVVAVVAYGLFCIFGTLFAAVLLNRFGKTCHT